jgi:hypothetical protein
MVEEKRGGARSRIGWHVPQLRAAYQSETQQQWGRAGKAQTNSELISTELGTSVAGTQADQKHSHTMRAIGTYVLYQC